MPDRNTNTPTPKPAALTDSEIEQRASDPLRQSRDRVCEALDKQIANPPRKRR